MGTVRVWHSHDFSTECPCGKRCYASRRAARRQLKHLRGVSGYVGEVYRCRKGCGWWHVGRQLVAGR